MEKRDCINLPQRSSKPCPDRSKSHVAALEVQKDGGLRTASHAALHMCAVRLQVSPPPAIDANASNAFPNRRPAVP